MCIASCTVFNSGLSSNDRCQKYWVFLKESEPKVRDLKSSTCNMFLKTVVSLNIQAHYLRSAILSTLVSKLLAALQFIFLFIYFLIKPCPAENNSVNISKGAFMHFHFKLVYLLSFVHVDFGHPAEIISHSRLFSSVEVLSWSSQNTEFVFLKLTV